MDPLFLLSVNGGGLFGRTECLHGDLSLSLDIQYQYSWWGARSTFLHTLSTLSLLLEWGLEFQVLQECQVTWASWLSVRHTLRCGKLIHQISVIAKSMSLSSQSLQVVGWLLCLDPCLLVELLWLDPSLILDRIVWKSLPGHCQIQWITSLRHCRLARGLASPCEPGWVRVKMRAERKQRLWDVPQHIYVYTSIHVTVYVVTSSCNMGGWHHHHVPHCRTS